MTLDRLIIGQEPAIRTLPLMGRLGDDQKRTLVGRAAGCFATGMSRSLPLLRTDSVNRGFCISFLTLATVVLVGVIGVFPFFFIPQR
jgi:hypothetical protein